MAFSFFGGQAGQNPAAGTSTTAPQPSQPSQSSAGSTPQSEPLAPDITPQQPQPSAQPAPSQPSSTPGQFDMAAAILGGGTGSQQPQTPDPLADAASLMQNMFSGQTQDPGQPAVRINEQALRTAMGDVDLTAGIDWSAVEEKMQQGGSVQEAIGAALQAQGVNVMTAMAPVMNMFVQQAVEQAVQQAVSSSRESLTSSSIVSAMREKYAYAQNPVASTLIENLANQMARTLPPNTPMEKVTTRMDELFRQFSGALADKPNDPAARPGAQSDFTGLFSS